MFRPSTFTHDSWKSTMSVQEIEKIEKDCDVLMEKMDYKRL